MIGCHDTPAWWNHPVSTHYTFHSFQLNNLSFERDKLRRRVIRLSKANTRFFFQVFLNDVVYAPNREKIAPIFLIIIFTLNYRGEAVCCDTFANINFFSNDETIISNF